MRIFHTADIQIEVRNSAQRYDEFSMMLSRIISSVELYKPDIVVIAGDLTEYYNPNATEQWLLVQFLKTLCNVDSVKEIVIIKGNHDINQRKGLNTYESEGNKEFAPDYLDSLMLSMDLPKLHYLPESRLYESFAGDFRWLVWSQEHKHKSSDLHYNPKQNVSLSDLTTLPYITLYHDCIKNAINFDGKPVRNSSSKESPEDLGFDGLIIAGDIHQHHIIKNENYLFTYCGSPIPRDFGEGDYWKNGVLKQTSVNNHGFNIIDVNEDFTEFQVSWRPLQQYKVFVTFDIDKNCIDASLIDLMFYEDASEIALKIRNNDNSEQGYISAQNIHDIFVRFCKEHDIKLTVQITADKQLSEDIYAEAVYLNTLVSNEKIKEVAKDFIEQKVAKSRSVPKEDKKAVSEKIYSLFVQRFEQYDRNSSVRRINFMSLSASNFMAFGDDIEVEFENGLTKLTGTNGIGKTTLYNCIKWLTTGYVSTNQSAVNKKENRLLVMNDTRPGCDVTSASLKLLYNNNSCTIYRSVTRNWKSNTTIEQKTSENWREYCDMPEYEVVVEYLDKRYTGDEAEKFIESIFEGIQQVNRMLFVTPPSLFNLINTPSEGLNNSLLYNLGMAFFDELLDEYDSVREKSFEGISKPSESVSYYDSLIKEYEDGLIKIENIIKDKTSKIESNSEEISKIKKDIEDLQLSLSKISEEDISNTEKRLKETIDKRHKIEEIYDKKNKDLDNESKELDDKLKLIPSKEELSLKHKDSLNQKQDIKEAINTNKIEIEVIKNKISERKNSIIESVRNIVEGEKKGIEYRNNTINELNTKILNLDIEKSELKTQFTSDKNSIETKCRDEQYAIEQLNNTLFKKESEICMSIDNIENKISDLKKQISELENSTVCPTCKRKLEENDLKIIADKISNLNSRIEELQQESNKLTNELEELKTEIQKNIDEINHLLEKSHKDKKVIEQKYNKLVNQITVKQDSIKNDISNHKKVIETIEKSLEERKKNLIETINTDSEILSYQQKIEDLIKENAEKTSCIEIVDKIIEEVSNKIDEISEIENRKHQIELEYANLEKFLNEINSCTLQEIGYEDYLNSCKEYIEKDKKIKDAINTRKQILDSIEAENTSLVGDINNNNVQLGINKSKIEEYKVCIQQAIQYRIIDASMKIYKSCIGKSGLPIYIFSMIKHELNTALHDSLKNLPIDIFFNESNQLRMVTDNGVVRDVSRTSGMESTFAGLALIRVLKNKNVMNLVDILFIDEISGMLNDGSDLSYEAINFQNSLKELLSNMKKEFKIFIVDHVIKNLDEDNRYEVIKGNDGNMVVKIS